MTSIFSYTPEELSRFVTDSGVHQTLDWLCENSYITKEVRNDLQSRLVITAVNPSWPQRIVRRFFNKEDKNGRFMFVLSVLPPPNTTEISNAEAWNQAIK